MEADKEDLDNLFRPLTEREKFYADAERDSLKDMSNWPYNESKGELPKHKDMVNSPKHYVGKGMEVIDVIDAFDLDLYAGSIVQYVIRYKQKDGLQDLEKAKWFLERLIKKEKNKKC